MIIAENHGHNYIYTFPKKRFKILQLIDRSGFVASC